MKGSVKVMRSYDYCHFEVVLGSDEDMTLEQIDDMRKDAARLADKAVKQYQIMKSWTQDNLGRQMKLDELRRQVQIIRENYPQSEWSEDQKGTIKALEDIEWRRSHEYDYEDDWGTETPF